MFIILIIIILLILLLMKINKKTNDVYEIAYKLGIDYLNKIDYSPNYMVMFDIDDTLLDYNLKPIKPIIKLMKECNKRNLKVIIITARDNLYTNETIADLIHNNIYLKTNEIPKKAVYYDFIYLRHSPKDDNEMFKSKVKEDLFNQNLFTIMSIGDNNIDIVGRYSGYGIKLPNRKDPRLFHLNSKKQLENVKIN